MIIVVFLLPLISFAQVNSATCSKSGYTVEAINGIFTKDEGLDGAKENRKALERHLPSVYHGEKLTIDYLYNPTHGLIDLTDVAIQKTFEGVDMQDPDFLKILNAASTQVKTQKLLLVAHSQGNFYANNFYKAVTDDGDVSQKSIGVYGVATPASYVAGNGTYRTSDTDTVINHARKALPGTFLPAYDSINYKMSDDSGRGHGFREIYLNYRGEEIKREIEASLDKLSNDSARSEDTLCINPPKSLSTIEKVNNAVVYPVDAVISVGAVALTARKNAIMDFAISSFKKDILVAIGTYNGAVNTVVWTFDTAVATAQWTYYTAVAVGNSVLNTANALASATYNVFTGTLMSGTFASNNMASVILATQTQPQVTQSSPLVNVSSNKIPIVTQALPTNNQTTPVAPSQTQTVFVFSPKVQNGTSAPKLVFVGSFGGGGSQVLGAQSTASGANEIVISEEPIGNAGVALVAPALSAPQCAQTLATDGCLLATTTVHFDWSPVSGADYYLINKNGEYGTTTDTSFDVTARDFSDYTLEVIAVGTDGEPSATSTQKVSVATIPIAINEIAWMGTVASTTNEWFEIKNNTGHTIDISQWELNARDGTPHVKLGGIIKPKEYLVFERISDKTISDVSAHQIYTGALGNKGEQLNLSHASTTFDQTPEIVNGEWVAGYNSTSSKQTMERYSSRESGADPANWGTNLGYIKNGKDANGKDIEGTPGEQNSVSTLINKGQEITSDFTLTADEERYVIAENSAVVTASTTLTVEPGVVINFYKNGKIYVAGALDAQGTPANPIILSSFDDTVAGGITISNSTGTTTISNARIRGTNGIDAYGSSTNLDISNTIFDGNAIAVELYSGAQASIASSTILNTFDNDAIGVYNSTMTIASTTIDGVPDGSGVGVYYSTVSIASSTIRNVSGSGVSIYRATSTISNTIIENAGWSGIEVYQGTATVASTTISGVVRWAGIEVDEGTLTVSSSTIKNVSIDGISAYNSTSNISNVTIENGGGNGVSLYGGMTTIASSTISGFVDGAGVAVSLQREWEGSERKVVPGVVAEVSGSEITGNATGIDMEVGSAIIAPDVSVHDNGTSEADNVVVW